MADRLRCVFASSALLDADPRLAAMALEACARAGVEVVGDDEDPEAVVRDRGYAPQACIAVGAELADAPAGTVWVGPLDLDVRGRHVRVAEDGDALFYEAVITELAERRR